MSPTYVSMFNWSISSVNKSVKVYMKINNTIVVKLYYINAWRIVEDKIQVKCNRVKTENEDEWTSCDLIINLNIQNHSYIQKGMNYEKYVPHTLGEATGFHHGRTTNVTLEQTFANVQARLRSSGASLDII